MSRILPSVFGSLCISVPLFASTITIFSDEMNSGSLNPQININATGAIIPTLSYVPTGGVPGLDGIAGGYTQYNVDSTGAGDPWYAGFGYYGAPGSPSPIHYTVPSQIPLEDVDFTFDGEATGGNPLNVGVRVEAWNNNNSQQLGVFFLLPLTINSSFEQIGGALSTFSFFSPVGLTADQAMDMATDWRFIFSFAGTATKKVFDNPAIVRPGMKSAMRLWPFWFYANATCANILAGTNTICLPIQRVVAREGVQGVNDPCLLSVGAAHKFWLRRSFRPSAGAA